MINDELRWKIENAQRIKCFFSSIISVSAFAIWIALLNDNAIPRNGTIVVTITATVFTAISLATIFCNLGKETFEVKYDPTKG